MAKRKSRDTVPDRKKNWDYIFKALVTLSRKQEQDRHYLEEKNKYLLEVIHKMKMGKKFESLKGELMLGFKHREAIVYKYRYESADDELAAFREWFDRLTHQRLAPASTSGDVSNKGGGSRNNALQDEVLKLKREIEKFNSEKNSLSSENNFVWNQVRYKSNELERANEKVQALVKRTEELQFLNERLRTDFTRMESESVQKSEEISRFIKRTEELQFLNERLRTDFTRMESESVQKSEEISRLLKEIDHLKLKSGSTTPVRRWRAKSVGPQKEGKNSTTNGSVTMVKKELDSSRTVEKTARKSTGGKAPKKQFMTPQETSSSKRKAVEVIRIPDTPKLFTSSFRKPKLKSLSSPQVV